MNQSITLEDLQRSIEAFYGQSPDEPLTEEVAHCRRLQHEWLIQAEDSPEMWQMIWPLLNPEMSDIMQYFGVNALYNKLCRNWDQIQSRSEELKNQIWEVILYYERNSGSKITLRKLCSSFAVLILKCLDETWPTAIVEMIENLKNANNHNESNGETPQSTQPPFLERLIFSILESVQVESKKTNAEKNASIRVRSILNRNQALVTSLVNSALKSLVESPSFQESSQDYRSMLQFANCLVSCSLNWLSLNEDDMVYNSAVQVFDLFVKIYSSRLCFVNYTDEESELTQTVYDWMSHVFETDQLDSDGKSTRLIQRLVTLFTDQMIPVLKNEIMSNGANDDDIAELVISFTKITELGMTEIFLSIGHIDNSQACPVTIETCGKILATALMCQSAPGAYPIEESYSNQMFNFWMKFFGHCELDNKRTFTKNLEYVITNLLTIFSEKGRIHFFEDELMKEDKELIYFYREDIVDTCFTMYSYFSKLVIDFFCNSFQQWMASDRTDWRALEVCLFNMQAVGHHVKEGEDAEKIVEIVRLVCEQIDFNLLDHQAQISALKLIQYTVETTSKVAEVVPVILTFVMKALRKPKLGLDATICFKDLFNKCDKNMLPYADELFNEFFQLISTNQQTRLLSEIDVIRLMHSLCRLMRIFEMTRYTAAFEMVLNPALAQIEECINTIDDNHLSILAHNLEIIATLFMWLKPEMRINVENSDARGHLYINHVIEMILQKFSAISQLAYFQHKSVKTPICNTCTTMVQRFAIDFPGLTKAISSFPLSALRKYNFSAAFQNIGSIIMACSENNAFFDVIRELFCDSLNIVLNKINDSSTPITEDKNKFNLVVDYFTMLRNIVCEKTVAFNYFPDNHFAAVIDFAIKCLLISSFPIQKSVAGFFVVMIPKRKESNIINWQLSHSMESIVTTIFCLFRRPVPLSLIEPLTTIIHVSKRNYRSDFTALCRKILFENGPNHIADQFPTEHVTRVEKEELLAMLNARDRNQRDLSKAVALFASRCVRNNQSMAA